MKNKKGFTLVEMVVVVGMIVILTSAFAVTIVQNIQKSKDTKAAVELHYSDGFMEAKAQVEALRGAGYGEPDGYTPEPDPDPVDPDPVDPDPVDPDPVDPDPVDPGEDETDTTPILPANNPNLSVVLTQSTPTFEDGLYSYACSFSVTNTSTINQEWISIQFIVPEGTAVSSIEGGSATVEGQLLTIVPPNEYQDLIRKGKTISLKIVLTNAGEFVVDQFVVV